MDVSSHFSCVVPDLEKKFLLEGDLHISFSTYKKVYYQIVRPFLPIKIRQYLQGRYARKVKFRADFVYSDYVDAVRQCGCLEEGAKLFPGGARAAVVLTHDVEEKRGFDNIPKIIDVLTQFCYRASWNIVPYKYKIDQGIIRDIWSAGHEIGIHGYNHDGRLYYSEKIFTERARLINEALERFNAVGFRSPQVHRNLVWLQKLNIQYDSSCFDYDPFQPFPGGVGSIWPFRAGKFVELPYTVPQDHVMFYMLKQGNIEIWKRKVDWLVENGGMILTIAHPDYLLEKNNLAHYIELLEYLNGIGNTWHCLPREMAERYMEVTED